MSKTTKRKKNFFEIQPKKLKEKTSKPVDSMKTTQSSSSTTTKISDDDLKYLKQFDLDMTFGPCTGITRRERYERAIRHELNPPVRVLELIEQFPNDRDVTHNLWQDYTL